MVDLKDRINKPRSVRGTPSYAYITKLSAIAVLAIGFTGTCFGYYFYRKERLREDYGKATTETVNQNTNEDRVRLYVENRKREMRFSKKLQDEEEFFP